MLKKLKRLIVAGIFGLATVIATTGTSNGSMMLTAAGTGAGFTLTTFADRFPNNGVVGPVGIAFTPTGGVMISSYAAGYNAVFATDTDNQHYSAATLSTTFFGGNNVAGIASVGSNYYQALQSSSAVVRIDSSGNYLSTIFTVPFATGLVANPANGHLFVSNGGSVFDINPITPSITLFGNLPFDGMTITPDGKTLYGAANTGHILGYDTTSGLQVFDSGFIPGGIDGSALGTGSLAGNIFVNINNGTLVEVNLATKIQTLIASGGSRGDFVQADPNGSLLLTQTDSVLRLTAPPGGGFNPVPEPSSLALMGLGGIGMAFGAYRRRRAAHPV